MRLSLLDWAAKGATIAESDGREILIDRGIPGERALTTVDRDRKPWRGVVDQVLEAAPGRVDPPCPYFLRGCGGCQWQHLSYGGQIEAKRSLVERDLRSAGVATEVVSVHEMSEPWRYRYTASIALGWEAGFRPRARRGILEIHDCLISHPLIGQLADRMNELLRTLPLRNYHGKVWLDCTVIGTIADPGLQVLIQGIDGLTVETHPELSAFAETVATIDFVRTVAYRHRSGEVLPIIGDLMSTLEIGGRSMYVPAGSFVQTNVRMVPHLLRRMREVLEGPRVRDAADIYGGVGTFGLPLAQYVERMTLVEMDPLAVDAARCTARSWQLANVDFVSRHAEHALPALASLDVAIVDPPRSGLGDAVTGALLRNGVPTVFYVSCSPSSLARDLPALQAGGLCARWVEIFDFYPQTFHVECLVLLTR